MRVIGGEFRSRRLKTLSGQAMRPTPDRLRETLFDVLVWRIEGAIFLDAYAGTGAVGIEALSRGARRAIFLEKHRAAVKLIHENLAALGIGERASVLAGPALASLDSSAAGIVFLDPPYALEHEYGEDLQKLGQKPPSLAIVQHSVRHQLEDGYGELRRARTIRQGDNALTFYAPASPV
jgi:16S rRNA (guanine(966)-N(2))-methyltransferase RsmD